MRDMILYSALAILLLLVFSVYADAASTSVTVRPKRIDMVEYGNQMARIVIETDDPGEYDISISGIPSDWIDYPKSVDVDGKETVTYMLNPKDPGEYHFTVAVDGPGGEFEEEVSLWVGSEDIGSGKPSHEESGSDGLTGMFIVNEENQTLMIYAAIAIAAVFAVFLGHMTLKHENEEQYEKVY